MTRFTATSRHGRRITGSSLLPPDQLTINLKALGFTDVKTHDDQENVVPIHRGA